MTPLWGLAKIFVLLVLTTQLACFVVALYEMLNLPEMRLTPLTASGLALALRDVLVESLVVIALAVTMPVGWMQRRRDRRGAAARPAIVLVAGWAATPAVMWLLRRRLAHAGWVEAIGYRYRSIGGDVRDAARGLGALIDTVSTRSGAPVIVLAHGIGGVIARLAALEGRGRGIVTVVTLGAPHHGSKLFALAFDPLLASLRAGSPLVDELVAADPSVIDVTAIYASFDVTVVPSSAGRCPGGANIEVEGVGHFGLLWSRRIAELVRENLEFAAESQDASAATQRATSPASE